MLGLDLNHFVLILGLIEATSSFLPVGLKATHISSANESRFGLMKSFIRTERFFRGVGISDESETIAKLLMPCN